jgi:hypothetical protein
MSIGRIPIAFWMTRATNVILEYVIIIAFPGDNGFTKAPPNYAIRTLHVSQKNKKKNERVSGEGKSGDPSEDW